jgi:hypothetical protein
MTDRVTNRHSVLFFGGEIGGIGKSTVARVAVEQKIAAKQEFYLIDADASTPNVGLTYEKAMYEGFLTQDPSSSNNPRSLDSGTKQKPRLKQRITFAGDVKSYLMADEILELAREKDTIVVLPSQVALYVNRWIEHNDIAGMLTDTDNSIDFYYFFVSNGTPESIGLFIDSVEKTQGKIPYVLVKNLGAVTNIDWKWFDHDRQAAAIVEKYQLKTVDFPELVILPEVKTKIFSENISFAKALTADWMPYPSKRRIATWLKTATQALGATELLPYHPEYLPRSI